VSVIHVHKEITIYNNIASQSDLVNI